MINNMEGVYCKLMCIISFLYYAGSKQMATTAIIAFTLVIVYVATVDSELAI